MKDNSTLLTFQAEGADVFLSIRGHCHANGAPQLYAECMNTGRRAMTKPIPTAEAVRLFSEALPLGIESFAAACSFLLSKGHALEYLKPCEPYRTSPEEANA
jgi:hypothetical protein